MLISTTMLLLTLNARNMGWISRPQLDDLAPPSSAAHPAGALLKATVSPAGRLENCTVAFASGNPEAAQRVCRRLEEKSRMKPERDANGKDIYGQIYIPIRFGDYYRPLEPVPGPVIPVDGAESRPGKTTQAQLVVTLSDTGAVESCEVAKSSGHPELDKRACDQGVPSSKLKPLTDAEGNPVRSAQSVFVGFTAPTAIPVSQARP